MTTASLATLLVGLLGLLEFYSVVVHHAPREVTWAELVQGRPDGEWVRVVDGQLDFDLYLAAKRPSGRVDRIFAPLRSPYWRRGPTPDRVTQAPVLVALEGEEATRRATSDSMLRRLGGVWVGGVERRPVDGIVHTVTAWSQADTRALDDLRAALPPSVLLIDAGERPNIALAIALLLTALVSGLVLFAASRALSPSREYGLASLVGISRPGVGRPPVRRRGRR